jgi:hypothetical protein
VLLLLHLLLSLMLLSVLLLHCRSSRRCVLRPSAQRAVLLHLLLHLLLLLLPLLLLHCLKCPLTSLRAASTSSKGSAAARLTTRMDVTCSSTCTAPHAGGSRRQAHNKQQA